MHLLCPWNSLGRNIRVDCRSLIQGIVPTQGSNLSLPHCWQILYCLSYQGNIINYYSAVLYNGLC